MSDFSIRLATIKDSETILEFIKKIAEYENMSDEVINTKEKIEEVVFNNNAAKCFLGIDNNKPVGFALFYEIYSTFTGQKGIHLEDIFVDSDMRSKGYGKLLFKAVADYAEKGGYLRMEWCCLDWNKPSQDFYSYMGGKHLSDWWTYRLSDDSLKNVKNK